MRTVAMIIQIIACVILIASILLQSGKSAGLSGAISGGAEQLWGKKKGRGYEGLLSKITTAGAIIFIICSLVLVNLE